MVHDCLVMYEKLFARSGLSLDRLRSFREMVASRGISAAARSDPSRQSQLSRQLRELEKFFGVELVRRGRGTFRLTEPGRELDRIAQGFLTTLEEFQSTCSQEPVRLNVGAGESLIQWWILPRLPRHDGRSNRWTFAFENLRNDEILDRIREGSLDLGIVTRAVKDAACQSEMVGTLEYALFVPRSLRTEGKLLNRRSPLAGLPLALLTGSPAIAEAVAMEAARGQEKANVVLYLSSYPQLAAAVREGQAAAVMPTIAAGSLVGSDVQRVRPAFLNALNRPVTLVWNRSVAEIRSSVGAAGKVLGSLLRAKAPVDRR